MGHQDPDKSRPAGKPAVRSAGRVCAPGRINRERPRNTNTANQDKGALPKGLPRQLAASTGRQTKARLGLPLTAMSGLRKGRGEEAPPRASRGEPPAEQDAVMHSSRHFTPWQSNTRPCWHCRNYAGLLYGGSAAACKLRNGPRVRSMPATGCASFEREVGADDEPDQVPDTYSASGVHGGPWNASKDLPLAQVPILWAP